MTTEPISAARLAAYTLLGVLAVVAMVVVAFVAVGLWFLAVVVVGLPTLLRRRERFAPTDEDLHAWIEGRRG